MNIKQKISFNRKNLQAILDKVNYSNQKHHFGYTLITANSNQLLQRSVDNLNLDDKSLAQIINQAQFFEENNIPFVIKLDKQSRCLSQKEVLKQIKLSLLQKYYLQKFFNQFL